MLDLLIGTLVSYTLTSVWETIVHWKILHANRISRLRWKRLGGIFNLLRKAHFSHNVIHHKKTYKSNYFIQFDSKEEKEVLDSKLDPRPEFRIKCNRYGLNISGFWEILVFIGAPLSVSVVVFYILSPTYMWVGAIIAILPMLLSKYMHPLLHNNRALSDIDFSWLKVVVNSRYFKYIQRYHFIHHQYSLCNFNLMLGGDYLLGVSRKPKPNNIGMGSYMAGQSSIRGIGRGF